MASPTGCTKQLIRVAWMSVPAALMMRPAPMAPACRLSRKRCSHSARSASFSTEASARATRRYRSSRPDSPGFRYFSASTSWLMGWVAVRSWGRMVLSRFISVFVGKSERGRPGCGVVAGWLGSGMPSCGRRTTGRVKTTRHFALPGAGSTTTHPMPVPFPSEFGGGTRLPRPARARQLPPEQAIRFLYASLHPSERICPSCST